MNQKGEFSLEEKQQLEKEVIFLKKRLDQCKKENDILRKDNKVLRGEMGSLKETVKNIALARPKTAIEKSKTIQNEDQLRFILEYQRKRLDEVEKELETHKSKYEQLLYQNQRNSSSRMNANQTEENTIVKPESVFLSEQYSQSTQQVIDLKNKNEQLEDKIKLITTQYAQEMASLKSKLAKQDAILITSSNNIINSNNNSYLGSSNYLSNNSNNNFSNASSLAYNSISKVSLDPLLSSPSLHTQSANNGSYGNNQYNNNAVQFSNGQTSTSKSQRQSSQSNIQYENDSMFTYKKKKY